MGKKDKNKKKGKGAEKTAMKTDKKLAAKQKKILEKLGEADITQVVASLELEQARRKATTEEVCAPPSPRSSFSLVTHPDKDELVLFGGEFYNGQKVCIYNDLFFYNITKNEWRQLHAVAGPTPRSGHQMVAVAIDGGQLWMFGGEYASPSQMQYFHFKDLWVLRLKTREWEKLNAPNGPSARSGHRMVASKKRLVVFGGFHDNNQSYRYFNDLHVFFLETYTWQNIEISGAILPQPRSGCCMAACPDGRVLVWGGYSKEQIKKDVDRGITHTDMFSLVPDKNNPNKLKWSTIKPGGYKPLPRSSVGYTTAPNGKSYCFGGVMDVDENEEDVHGQFGDDLLSLDLAALTWRLLEVTKRKSVKGGSGSHLPNEVDMMEETTSAPTVTTDGVFTVTVAGPSNTDQTATKTPSLFPDRRPKSIPSARMNPGICVSKGTLYLYGGLYEEDSKTYTFNDFYSLDLHKLDGWKTIIASNLNAHDWVESDISDSEEDDDSKESDDSEETESEDDGMDTE